MTKFFYKAKNWNGKTVQGVLDMSDREAVVESVKGGGLVPLEVSVYKESMVVEALRRATGHIGLKQISELTRQLSTMMTAGLPLTDALSLLKVQFEGKVTMYEILDHCLTTVRGGQSLGRALEKYKNVFGEAYVASVDAGESAGVLEEVLAKLAANLEKDSEFQGKVKGAMIYPIIVVIAMVIVAMIMMIFVIPKLLGLYADFGTAKLPASTQALMSISNFMTRWWFMFPIIIIGAAMGIKAGSVSHDFRMKLDGFKLKIPIMGVLTNKTILANTTRTLSMLLTAGIGLVEALKIVAKVAGNEVYLTAYEKIAERVQKGFPISNSFEEQTLFPPIVNQMVSTGEATGKLDEVLMRVADYFSTEAEQSVKALTSAIEPLIMIVLGIGVGFLVIAVIMPIYNLTSSF
jgi:type IV pilus assembly protein PilC